MLIGGASATPTFTDPDSKAAKAQEKVQEDLNRFLNLLVTQLKHQDPLKPLDSNEFTAQLVQFASVEQQIYQNANLEKLLQLQTNTQVADMVGYLGTTVQAVGNQVPLENSRAEFMYGFDQAANSVTVTISDATGRTVYSVGGETSPGVHKVVWDGTDTQGNKLPDGSYTVTVSAFDRERNLMDVTQTVTGRVTGAGVEEGEVTLFLGDILVKQSDVLAVRETPASQDGGN